MLLLTTVWPEENSNIFIITQKNTTNITELKYNNYKQKFVKLLTYLNAA
jgi:hypothetical protein